MKVVKFGGSSVASASKISKVISIVTSDIQRKVVVVSAPGKRNKSDIKVTDLLIEIAEKVINNQGYHDILLNIIERFRDIQLELGLSTNIIAEIQADLHHRIEMFSGNN